MLEDYIDFITAVREIEIPFECGISEMSKEELQLLLYFLRRKHPSKVLEIGVSGGGTTKFILDALPKTAELISVDISEVWYHDRKKATGFVAHEFYDKNVHSDWKQFFGCDISECIHHIGNGIDFCILDTVHALPGEFLSFLAVLPYLKDDCIFVLHDIGLHTKRIFENNPAQMKKLMYCNLLLFSSIYPTEKFIHPDQFIPNIGALIINMHRYKYIKQVMQMLFIPWRYMPNDKILTLTKNIIKRYYDKDCLNLFISAVNYNKNTLSY